MSVESLEERRKAGERGIVVQFEPAAKTGSIDDEDGVDFPMMTGLAYEHLRDLSTLLNKEVLEVGLPTEEDGYKIHRKGGNVYYDAGVGMDAVIRFDYTKAGERHYLRDAGRWQLHLMFNETYDQVRLFEVLDGNLREERDFTFKKFFQYSPG